MQRPECPFVPTSRPRFVRALFLFFAAEIYRLRQHRHIPCAVTYPASPPDVENTNDMHGVRSRGGTEVGHTQWQQHSSSSSSSGSSLPLATKATKSRLSKGPGMGRGFLVPRSEAGPAAPPFTGLPRAEKTRPAAEFEAEAQKYLARQPRAAPAGPAGSSTLPAGEVEVLTLDFPRVAGTIGDSWAGAWRHPRVPGERRRDVGVGAGAAHRGRRGVARGVLAPAGRRERVRGADGGREHRHGFRSGARSTRGAPDVRRVLLRAPLRQNAVRDGAAPAAEHRRARRPAGVRWARRRADGRVARLRQVHAMGTRPSRSPQRRGSSKTRCTWPAKKSCISSSKPTMSRAIRAPTSRFSRKLRSRSKSAPSASWRT